MKNKIVTLWKYDSYFLVEYSYDKELHLLMKEKQGKYIKSKTAWEYPLNKIDDIYNSIKNKGYQISIISNKDGKYISENIFDCPDVVGVYGYCSSCKKYRFLNKENLCYECK